MLSSGGCCKKVVGGLIEAVDLKVSWHSLFVYEHLSPYCDQCVDTTVPSYFANVHCKC